MRAVQDIYPCPEEPSQKFEGERLEPAEEGRVTEPCLHLQDGREEERRLKNFRTQARAWG